MQIYCVCWRYRCQPQNYVPSVHKMTTILCTLHFYFTFIKLKIELEHLESVSVECYSLWLIVSEFTKTIFLNIYPRSASMQMIRNVELEMHWIKSANISHIGLFWWKSYIGRGRRSKRTLDRGDSWKISIGGMIKKCWLPWTLILSLL